MKELTIGIENRSKSPLYQQIYQFIREEILGGRIKAGEVLPSTRALAKFNGISRSTVELAYEQLLAEGYIISRPYRGYYVCEVERFYQFQGKTEEWKVDSEKEETEYRLDFALNGIAPDGFPYNAWRKISKTVLDLEDKMLFQLGDPQGQKELRCVLAEYLYHSRGVNCAPSQILIGAGNDYLLMMLHLILGTDRVVAMENPTYISAYDTLCKLGYPICVMQPDEQGIHPIQLEDSKADLAYVMPSHQFPLGTVMPIKRRQQLLAWAAGKEGRYLLEDDYDSEFRYKGKPIPSLQGSDTHDCVIYLGTFSKSLAPAIRISYMVLPKKLVREYQERAGNFSTTVSRVDQKILEYFLRDGYYERHLNRMRSVYRNKLECFLQEMKNLQDICRIHGEHAGVHVMVELVNGLDGETAIKLAKKQGIRVYSLEDFAIEPLQKQEKTMLLMGYATLSEEEIKEGIRKLGEVWRKPIEK